MSDDELLPGEKERSVQQNGNEKVSNTLPNSANANNETELLGLRLEHDLSKKFSELIEAKFESFKAFVQDTYTFATNSIRTAMWLGGAVLVLGGIFGIKTIWDLDSKINTAVAAKVTSYFASEELAKKLQQDISLAKRRLIVNQLNQTVLTAELRDTSIAASGGQTESVGHFIDENIDDLVTVIGAADVLSTKCLRLLNEAIDRRLWQPASEMDQKGGLLLAAISKVFKNSQDSSLQREAYNFQIEAGDEGTVLEIVRSLNKVLSGDTQGTSYQLRDNAEAYLLRLAHNKRFAHSASFSEELTKASDAALNDRQKKYSYGVAGTFAKAWINQANSHDLEQKLSLLVNDVPSRKLFLGFLGTNCETIFRPSLPFEEFATPSVAFLAELYRRVLSDSAVGAKKDNTLNVFLSLSCSEPYYARLVPEVLNHLSTEEIPAAVETLIPEEPFFVSEKERIPKLFVKTKANHTYQMVIFGSDPEGVVPVERGHTNRASLRTEVGPLQPGEVQEWRVFFMTNPYYGMFDRS